MYSTYMYYTHRLIFGGLYNSVMYAYSIKFNADYEFPYLSPDTIVICNSFSNAFNKAIQIIAERGFLKANIHSIVNLGNISDQK